MEDSFKIVFIIFLLNDSNFFFTFDNLEVIFPFSLFILNDSDAEF